MHLQLMQGMPAVLLLLLVWIVHAAGVGQSSPLRAAGSQALYAIHTVSHTHSPAIQMKGCIGRTRVHGSSAHAPMIMAISCWRVSFTIIKAMSRWMGLASAFGSSTAKMTMATAATAAQNRTHMILQARTEGGTRVIQGSATPHSGTLLAGQAALSCSGRYSSGRYTAAAVLAHLCGQLPGEQITLLNEAWQALLRVLHEVG